MIDDETLKKILLYQFGWSQSVATQESILEYLAGSVLKK